MQYNINKSSLAIIQIIVVGNCWLGIQQYNCVVLLVWLYFKA